MELINKTNFADRARNVIGALAKKDRKTNERIKLPDGKFKFDSLEIALGLKDVFRAHFAAHADEISGKRFRGERL